MRPHVLRRTATHCESARLAIFCLMRWFVACSGLCGEVCAGSCSGNVALNLIVTAASVSEANKRSWPFQLGRPDRCEPLQVISLNLSTHCTLVGCSALGMDRAWTYPSALGMDWWDMRSLSFRRKLGCVKKLLEKAEKGFKVRGNKKNV